MGESGLLPLIIIAEKNADIVEDAIESDPQRERWSGATRPDNVVLAVNTSSRNTAFSPKYRELKNT